MVSQCLAFHGATALDVAILRWYCRIASDFTSYALMISYDHLCIRSCWRDSQLEHTCNLQEGAFLPYFSMKIPSNRPVTTYKFLVRTCRNKRNERKWNLWDAHHRKLTRASSFAMFCLIRFTVVTCCYHPGRRRESRSERLGRCGQFHVQLGLQVHCQTAQKETRCDFWLQAKEKERSSSFLSAWRFMVRQP